MEAMDFGLWILVITTFGFGYIQGMYYYFVFLVWFLEWLCEEIVTIGNRDILN